MPVKIPLRPNELEILAQKYGTPFQLYDEYLIRQNARDLFSAFTRYFPNFKQFFAVKALPNPSILKILMDEGCGLDCSSVSELYIADKLNAKDVIFTSNYTSKIDLKYAFDQQAIINLDDISLINYLPKMPELICFRINPGTGNTQSETASNILGGPSAKFGVDVSQITDCYRIAKDRGALKFGIHMMTGSCVMNDEYWTESISRLLDIVNKIENELSIKFEFINVGGGIGIPYNENEKKININHLAKKMHVACDNHNLYMENGRYMTGPFGWLVSRCQAIKKIPNNTYYGLDASMANLMRPGMYGAYHHITVPTAFGEKKIAHVVGTLCENNDWFAKNRLLPIASVGDLFVIHDTGAHAHSMGFQYNGKLRAPELLRTLDGSVKLIRPRDTIDSLFPKKPWHW